jgi:hypothetical protein
MEAGAISDAGAVRGDVCASCGAALASDQRYCLECGHRVGGLALPGVWARARGQLNKSKLAGGGDGAARSAALPFGLPPLRMPAARSASAMAGIALAFGVFVGLALSPAFRNAGIAASRYVVQLPGGGNSDQSQTSSTPGVSPSAALGSPVGNVGGGGAAPTQAPGDTTAQVPTSTQTPPPTGSGPAGNTNTKQNHGGGHHPLPPSHEKPTVDGVVVHVNTLAKSYTVATNGEQLIAIHTDDLPDPRTRLSVGVRPLFNGTYAERGERELHGTRGNATFDGFVTYRDPQAGVYTVSKPGTSVLVHIPGGAKAGDPPELNNEVLVSATVEPPPADKRKRAKHGRTKHSYRLGRVRAATRRAKADASDGCSDEPIPGPAPSSVLQQRQVIVEGPPVGPVSVEGIVERACPDSGELGLSADDIRESAADIALASPDAIDLSSLEPGTPVDATMSIGQDGSYSLTGLSSDDGVTGANDVSSGQGDQAPKR